MNGGIPWAHGYRMPGSVLLPIYVVQGAISNKNESFTIDLVISEIAHIREACGAKQSRYFTSFKVPTLPLAMIHISITHSYIGFA